MLRIRILTASALGAALFVSLFALPTPWTVLVFAVVFTMAAWEWATFGALRAPLRIDVVEAGGGHVA